MAVPTWAQRWKVAIASPGGGFDLGSSGVFRPEVDGRQLTFHADGTGFVDAETGSQWELLGRAVSGPLAGRRLDPVATATISGSNGPRSGRGQGSIDDRSVTCVTAAPAPAEQHEVVPDKLWYLQRLNLFEEMGEAEIHAVSRELRMRSCPQGEPFATGERDRVYLLKAGRMRLYQLTEEGHEVTTAVLEPGQLFGLAALISGDGWATHAEPIEDSVVCDANAADFVAMLAKHPLLMA